MKYLKQKIIKFRHDKNFRYEDFFISKSNEHIYSLLDKWPKWSKNFLNISGESFSGKTHLVNIFLKKFKGIKLEAKLLNNDNLRSIKIHQNIIIENLDVNVDEEIAYTLFNIIDQDNKYLIVTSRKPIVDIKFRLNDLKSRAKNFLLQKIEKPDDEMIYALILKNLSDRQIMVEKKLINYIIKRIERSYSKIYKFIYKVDELSLKKKNLLI